MEQWKCHWHSVHRICASSFGRNLFLETLEVVLQGKCVLHGQGSSLVSISEYGVRCTINENWTKENIKAVILRIISIQIHQDPL